MRRALFFIPNVREYSMPCGVLLCLTTNRTNLTNAMRRVYVLAPTDGTDNTDYRGPRIARTIFVKPDEQSQARLSYAMARKFARSELYESMRHVSCRQKPEKHPLAGTLRVSMPAACALLVQASLQRTAPTTGIKCLRHFARRRAINRNKPAWHASLARSQRSPSA